MKKTSLMALAFALVAAAAPAAHTSDGPCTAPGGPGGDWPLYAHDLDGTRFQPAEDKIGPATVSSLRPAWVGVGSGNSTPVVQGRCVYAAGADGFVRAWDLATGTPVWQSPTSLTPDGRNGVLYGLSVDAGRVHVNVEYLEFPRSLAFDADTGVRLWTGEAIEFGYPAWQLSNAVPFEDMVLQATTGPDADPKARPGYAILDRVTGAVLHKQTTIPTEDLDDGYAGGGMWATPVIDATTKYAYVGTANPYSKKKEHRYDNAIIKIDLDRSRTTFGQVVDAYKGNVDQFVPGLDRQPACDLTGEDITWHPSEFSVTCVQLDIDFGASPTIFHNKKGERLVGELQKSGIYHVVYADTMQSAWQALLSEWPPGAIGNVGGSAYDGVNLYVAAWPDKLVALNPDDGRIRWVVPSGSNSYHPISVANGVVYQYGHEGLLWAHDAATGVPLWIAAPPLDASYPCNVNLTSGGIAIAQHTVIVNCDGRLVAYRLPP